MERAVFDRMAEQDEVHWWYVARRRILHDLIAREIELPADARILDVSAGSASLNIERISYLASGKVIEFTRSVYRGDA